MALILNGDTGVSPNGMPPGTVIQTVQGVYSTESNTTSTSFVSTGITATITPQFANSTILVLASPMIYFDRVGASDNIGATVIYRNGSQLGASYTGYRTYDRGGSGIQAWSRPAINFIDTPASTSALTYTLYAKVTSSSSNCSWNLTEAGATTYSQITLMEIRVA